MVTGRRLDPGPSPSYARACIRWAASGRGNERFHASPGRLVGNRCNGSFEPLASAGLRDLCRQPRFGSGNRQRAAGAADRSGLQPQLRRPFRHQHLCHQPAGQLLPAGGSAGRQQRAERRLHGRIELSWRDDWRGHRCGSAVRDSGRQQTALSGLRAEARHRPL